MKLEFCGQDGLERIEEHEAAELAEVTTIQESGIKPADSEPGVRGHIKSRLRTYRKQRGQGRYLCDCDSEVTCSNEAAWANADVALRLGEVSDLIAVHITEEGFCWWMDVTETMRSCDSATVDAGGEWYVLFRCDTKDTRLQGSIAPGVRVIGEGEVIPLPPSRDKNGDYCMWVESPITLPQLPEWIVNSLAVPKIV